VAKILVADDNSNIQKMVGLALKDQGIDVVAVGNGEAAVRKLADVKPDLVLADVFMPVRNGYEVCKYIKDDPAFAHIPVILLVGAFDPLDEQEAQRVGADGVLKKPFVPPDPLISMVKSALARAGVLVGAAAAEKAQETARNAADLLRANAAATKLAALEAAKVPEAEAEPVEEFPPLQAPVKIDADHASPVAFGSLLDTTETGSEEEDAAFVPAGKGLPLERSWGAESDDVAEEVEEEADESAHGGWRPAGLDDVDDAAAAAKSGPDWREEAFHGSSPARNGRSSHWTPSAEKHQIAEVAEAPAVGVSTLEHKPADVHEPVHVPVPVPFSGDAWAAAMAAGEEEKLGAAEALVHETEHLEAAAPEAAVAEVISQETSNSVIAEEEPVASAYESAPTAAPIPEPEAKAADTTEPEVERAVSKPTESGTNWFSVPPSPWDLEARKVSQLAATWDMPAPAVKSPEETQEIPAYQEPKSEHHVADVKVDESVPAESARDEHSESEAIHETVFPAHATHEPAHTEPSEVSTVATENRATADVPGPNMDELVARVLEKMNPDMLHKVTQELLKPIIEALVKDELQPKK
jgi:CheY-like chemotaxis protein